MNKRVLFVDDEQKVLDALQRMLRPMRDKWDMKFVSSGQNALASLSTEPFDVLITDMRMPDMDGVQLLKEVRNVYPEVVRIVLSGQSGGEMFLKSVRLAHQYLSKPCDAEALRATVERACTLRDWLANNTIKRVVSSMESIPSVPALYAEIVKALESPDVQVGRVATIIARDVGMTAKVLQLVNSAFFALPQHVTGITQAASLLGLDTIKSLVLSVQIFSQFEEKKMSAFNIDKIWRHSLRVGVAAKAIMKREIKDQSAIDDALMAGTLHDMGKFILAANLPNEYVHIKEVAEMENITLVESERKLLGTTHAEIGGYLLALWALPDSIVEAVTFHHSPDHCLASSMAPMAVVHLADILEHQCRSGIKEARGRGFDERYVKKYSDDRIAAWRDICEHIDREESDNDG
ncbi:MAG TPA: response regulator [Syntrophorhabdales bacterium]|nr:response regulator [Syntrophorhabdales bacterium]